MEGASTLDVTFPANPIAESNDFATQVLRDPWDMNEYTDVSQYINESGQRLILRDVQTQNGIFSATGLNDAVTGDSNAYFFPLFTGYSNDANNDPVAYIGKTGLNYPIDARTYRCVHIALKTNSGASSALGPDVLRVFWFSSPLLNAPNGGPWGLTYDLLYPEAGAGQPTHSWRLYTINLASPPFQTTGAGWASQQRWLGLRIDPTANRPNIPFQVDWVRLTDCAPTFQTISWTPNQGVNAIWIRPVGTDRDIRVAKDINGASGAHRLDTQGIAPGTYTVGVGTTTTCCSQRSATQLVINQTPIPQFARPSTTSGEDYATLAGNPWDFSETSDGMVTFGVGRVPPTSSYANGVLSVTTPPGPLPAGIDTQIGLNSPTTASTGEFRYLNFRMFNGGAWQNVPESTIARWIWSVQGTSGRAGFRCNLVGPDLPLDVGWQTYSVDLWDARNGQAEDRQGECPAGPLGWRSASPVFTMRFDPNENVTGELNPKTPAENLLQQLDWIRLTKEDRVTSGQPFRVIVGLNKGGVASRTVFYTTDRAQPKQQQAREFSTQPRRSGDERILLPFAAGATVGVNIDPVTNAFEFLWDTNGVRPGRYFVCVELNDGLNASVQCSDAPVLVQ
jgi:hypothetical protein